MIFGHFDPYDVLEDYQFIGLYNLLGGNYEKSI